MQILGGDLKIYPAIVEGAQNFSKKLERAYENSMKYLLMSSTFSPAIIDDPSPQCMEFAYLSLSWPK